MRVTVVQTDPEFGNVLANVSDALSWMRGAGQSDLFVLPELFNTGYDFESAEEAARLAEQEDGATSARISAFAKEHACWVAFGFAEKADRLYNSALLVGPGGIVGKYRKIHLYNRENLFFAPGNLGFPVFDLPFGRIGMMVCFDWIYPESARTLALKGATLIAHPSNLVLPHCPDAMVTRCLENRVFAATANRIGQEERGGFAFTYIGKSQVVSPRGNILARLSAEKPGCATVEIDLREAADKKLNEFNDLFGGRRTDQYQTTAPRE